LIGSSDPKRLAGGRHFASVLFSALPRQSPVRFNLRELDIARGSKAEARFSAGQCLESIASDCNVNVVFRSNAVFQAERPAQLSMSAHV